MRQLALKYPLAWFYSFTFAISWAAWGLMALTNPGGASDMSALAVSPAGILTIVFSSLGGLGPLISLLLLDRVTKGTFSLKQLLQTMRLRGAFSVWMLLAVLALPLVTLLGEGVRAAVSGQDARFIQEGPDSLGWMVLPVMLIQYLASLVTSPLFEEPGWRGFALPRLQARFGNLGGSLLVGGLWWLWHQPMNMAFGIWPSWYGLAAMLAMSFLIDSLFNLSGRNLLVALLGHGAANTRNTFLYQSPANGFTLVALLILVGLLRLREWQIAHRKQKEGETAVIFRL